MPRGLEHVKIHAEAANLDATSGMFSRNNREDETMLRLNATGITGNNTHFEEKIQEEFFDENGSILGQEEENEFEVPQESKVGKKLSDLTTKRTIILVLAMLFSVPVFSKSTYVRDPDPYTIGLDLMK